MFPQSISELTPQVLAKALRMPEGSITSVAAEPIGQGVGLLCQLARVTPTYTRAAGDGPRSVIAKFPTSNPQTRQLTRQFKFYEREVTFYRRLAGEVSLPTAKCWHAEHDAESDTFLLLLGDLGDHRLEDQLNGCSADDAFLAMREIAALHAQWWNSPKLDALDWVPLAESDLNKGGLALYPIAWPFFLERFGAELPDDMKRVGERLSGQIAGLMDRFCDRPRTLCHGDYRLDNLFFAARPGQAPLTVVDWQIAIRGTGTYDVGYFVSQSLAPKLRREIELDLLRTYHDHLCAQGVRHYSFADCLDDYRWCHLFCFCYPVIGGGLGDISNARAVALGKAMTERSTAGIRDWKADEFLLAG